ncbi:MIP transporter [Polychaeton citri CBS 116435]|uniref:MIP transporter n=1 Tax=Polychaeton citri CBS 116435 TaxID=1314669 RepID=A0A9P4Q567_9PEZI|nr:MIP transporter [Polychaeton citri CBS 116435]
MHADLRRRLPLVTVSAPFAGRVGGNQDFIADLTTLGGEEAIKSQPDAVPLQSLQASLDLSGFFIRENWRMAIIEGWGTCLMVFFLGSVSSTATTLTTPPLANVLFGALASWIGLSLFLYAAGPASGGHLNPAITMATFFAGLCTLPRAVLYIIAQAVGAIVGAYWLRLGLGEDNFFPNQWIPGCTVGELSPNPAPISVGQLFVLEYMYSQASIFLAFGAGLDPRNARTLGPAFSPIVVGLSLALGVVSSALVREGYTGLSFNPARCLGLMTAKGELQYHYVHWLAPMAAAIVNGLFYYFAPPYQRDRKRVFNML